MVASRSKKKMHQYSPPQKKKKKIFTRFQGRFELTTSPICETMQAYEFKQL